MNNVENIEGSYFTNPHDSPYKWRQVSANGLLLATISQASPELYRVTLYDRQLGAPQWSGTWWTEREQTLSDSFGHAKQVAKNFLKPKDPDH